MRYCRSITALTALAVVTLVALPVHADLKLKKKASEVYVPKKVASAKVRDVGWDGSFVLGASISLASSHKVVGQADGESISLTGQVTGGLDYIKGMHEWRNILKLAETSAKTPGIDRFVKSNDLLSLDSLYLMRFKRFSWVGPYARFQWETTLFPTEDVRTDDVTYLAKDGAPIPGTNPRNFLRVADAFSPMTFRETLGAFAKAYTKPFLA
ncbi:MAG: hypothetical protein KAI47_16460, partial [Deltaproteobacteria bacterium]|nr:hypothetical protein [Deltaproteobacteria bacterium]